MLSRKSAVVIAIVMLAIFSGVTIETIGHGSSTLTDSSISSSSNALMVYSPENASVIPVSSAAEVIQVNLSINSSVSPVYIYDLSPANLSAFSGVSSVTLYSMPNLTHLNKTLYPYNYLEQNVTVDENTTIHLSLYLNSTDFSKMNTSIPTEGKIYPYVVEVLVESSSGAAGIGFTIIKIP